MKCFSDKVAVVTGGGSGIGAAICRMLADNSMTVVVADIEVEKAESVSAQIRDKGGHALAKHVDITSTRSCEELAETVNQR